MPERSGWPYSSPPFHRGSRAIQSRYGVLDRMEARGRQVVRNFVPDQHRELYEKLPYLFVGIVDDRHQPHASMIIGQPGFICTPDPYHLKIGIMPVSCDPVLRWLRPDTPIAVLAVEFETRRRNRMNGIIEEVSRDHFSIRVKRTFGNCPKYVTQRFVRVGALDETSLSIGRRSNVLDAHAAAIVRNADTFIIATALSPAELDRTSYHGIDVSHRGGPSGFVRVLDSRTLVAPEFPGNSHYNTLGNLLLHPLAGLLFVDFASTTTVHVTAHASIHWGDTSNDDTARPQHTIQYDITSVTTVSGAIPVTWKSST